MRLVPRLGLLAVSLAFAPAACGASTAATVHGPSFDASPEASGVADGAPGAGPADASADVVPGDAATEGGAAAPDWQRSVIYLAMPDRFSNGDPSNDDAGSPAATIRRTPTSSTAATSRACASTSPTCATSASAPSGSRRSTRRCRSATAPAATTATGRTRSTPTTARWSRSSARRRTSRASRATSTRPGCASSSTWSSTTRGAARASPRSTPDWFHAAGDVRAARQPRRLLPPQRPARLRAGEPRRRGVPHGPLARVGHAPAARRHPHGHGEERPHELLRAVLRAGGAGRDAGALPRRRVLRHRRASPTSRRPSPPASTRRSSSRSTRRSTTPSPRAARSTRWPRRWPAR